MKELLKKVSVSLLCLGMMICTLSIVPNVYASGELIEPYATEVCTVTKDVGLGDHGYVTITITMNYITNTKKYILAGVDITSHFSGAYPLARLSGTITTDPKINKEITRKYVNVSFTYMLNFGTSVDKTFAIQVLK